MYCKYCGKQNADGARFCAACGKPLPVMPVQQLEPRKTQKAVSGRLVAILVAALVLLLLIGGVGWAIATDRIPLGASQQTEEENDGLCAETDSASSAQAG
ncbi:MAG: zinc ribbon domain-containing protein, partial [Clostridiales bacterium]|nr:zinc ribbon domain-containing protein [Clostridiales bacterium]